MFILVPHLEGRKRPMILKLLFISGMLYLSYNEVRLIIHETLKVIKIIIHSKTTINK